MSWGGAGQSPWCSRCASGLAVCLAFLLLPQLSLSDPLVQPGCALGDSLVVSYTWPPVLCHTLHLHLPPSLPFFIFVYQNPFLSKKRTAQLKRLLSMHLIPQLVQK